MQFLIADLMALQGVDEAGTLWFLSSSESDKNHEIKGKSYGAFNFSEQCQ